MDRSTFSGGLTPELASKIITHSSQLGLSLVSQDAESSEFVDSDGRQLTIRGTRVEAITEPELLAISWVTRLLEQLNKL